MSNPLNYGEPAFPCPLVLDGAAVVPPETRGLSILDYFAGQVVNAVIRQDCGTDGSIYDDSPVAGRSGRIPADMRREQMARIAKDSYDIAAAMLAEKRRREGGEAR